MRIGYKLLDSRQDAKHRVDYYKLISNKCEWNNCFIKNQTLDKNISFYFLSIRVFGVFIFGQTAVYRIYTVSREPIRLPEFQYPVFGI